jgi:ribonuclease HII
MPQLDFFPSDYGLSPLQKVQYAAKTKPDSVESCVRSLDVFRVVAGVDESGRGPLAGPVVACACILPEKTRFKYIVDSKTLSEAEIIDTYHRLIKIPGIQFATSLVEADEIDRINILQATLLAMRGAVAALKVGLDLVLIDGNRTPCLSVPAVAVVKGDRHCRVISAASIIAKYTRDAIMREYDKQYPGYGFARHKGYGTSMHMQMLRRHGACPIHRKSFEPVRSVIC